MLITLKYMLYLDQFSYLCMSTMHPFFGHVVPSNNILYLDHFVPTLVISFLVQLGMKRLESQFVPKKFRTYFGHFVPTLVISYLGSVDIKCISLNTYSNTGVSFKLMFF